MPKFYDIHAHAMNVNHANLPGFLSRGETKGLFEKMETLWDTLRGLPRNIEAIIGYKKALNLLAMMENTIGEYFSVMETCLKENDIVSDQNVLKITPLDSPTIPPTEYHGIVITPLIIDFEWIKNQPGFDVHYQKPPHAPATKDDDQQILDMLKGIRDYVRECKNKHRKPLFEIYPFLGINPADKRFHERNIIDYLDVYFKNYSGEEAAFRAAFPTIDTIDLDGQDMNIGDNRFAGIKLYPPTGFDPWPSDPMPREKTKLLYDYCSEKAIPITVHCSTGGFILGNKEAAHQRTDPQRWDAILDTYPGLKINFAHMGWDNAQWQKKIATLILKYPDRVYTDFSSVACDGAYYKTIASFLHIAPSIENFVLFGSDFMINLLDIDSYNSFYRQFLENRDIGGRAKRKFGSANPQKFLFSCPAD